VGSGVCDTQPGGHSGVPKSVKRKRYVYQAPSEIFKIGTKMPELSSIPKLEAGESFAFNVEVSVSPSEAFQKWADDNKVNFTIGFVGKKSMSIKITLKDERSAILYKMWWKK
jgi:hypothetical protein